MTTIKELVSYTTNNGKMRLEVYGSQLYLFKLKTRFMGIEKWETMQVLDLDNQKQAMAVFYKVLQEYRERELV